MPSRQARAFALRTAAVALSMVTIASAQQSVDRAGTSERRSDVSVTFSGGRSDNVLQTDINPTSSTYMAPGVILDIARDRSRMRFTVEGDLEFREYSSSLVEDELYGNLNAEVEFRVIPDRLSWLVRNNYGQGRPNSFLASGPGNRERVNVFTTGPALFVPFADRNELRASILTGDRSYDSSSQFEGDTLLSEVGLFRRTSTTSEMGFAFSQRDVEYANPIFDNDVNNIYFSYGKTLASGSANLRIGTSEVDINGIKDDIALFDLSWIRNVGVRSQLEVDLVNEFVDAGDEFRGGDSSADQFISVDVYQRTSAGIGFSIFGDRSVVRVGARIGEDRYQRILALDNEVSELQFDFEREISAVMNFGLRAYATDLEFRLLDRTDRDFIYAVWIDRSFGRRLNLNIEFEHDARSSNLFGDFDENTLIFSLRFNLNQTTSEEI